MSGTPEDRPDRATTFRYATLQVPGLLLAGVLAVAAVRWFDVPRWAAVVSVALWVVKDALMFPFVWRAYSTRDGGGPHDVRGRIGTVEEALVPNGWIRVGSERWRASALHGHGEIPQGSSVRVIAVEGLKLTVEPADAQDPAASSDHP